MAKLKTNKSAATEAEELMEEAVSTPITLSDEEEEVFELLRGYVDEEGVVHKEFTLREMTGKDEEAIHRSDIKNNGSKAVSLLLSRCVTRIGSLTLKSCGREKWEKIIKSLYVGDQDYVLVQLRKLSIGEELEVDHVCPNKSCRAKLHTTANMDELEVVPFQGLDKIPFELKRGYKDKKGKIHTTGIMRLPTGLDREILTPLAKNNLAKAETTMLTRLCTFTDGQYVDDDVMGSLSIRDREYLQNILQENFFGIKTEIEVTCDSCGETFTGSLNATNFI